MITKEHLNKLRGVIYSPRIENGKIKGNIFLQEYQLNEANRIVCEALEVDSVTDIELLERELGLSIIYITL